MQRRQVVIGDIIHGHVVLEQELDAVQVVPLCGHVERRQTVLREGGGHKEGKKERKRGGKKRARQKERDKHTHADEHIDRWTDR